MVHNSFKLIDIISLKKSKGFLSGDYKTLFNWVWIEFEDISQYNYWDNIRSIDWLTSAKRNEIYIKKFQEEKEFPVLFIFDISSSMFFWFEEITKMDSVMNVFKILSLSALRNNSPIWVSFMKDNGIVSLEPKRWRINILRAYKMIKDYIQEKLSINNLLSIIIEYLFKNKIKNNIIFVFSDKTSIDNDSKLKALSIQNDLIYIHVSDSFENNLSTSWLVNLWNSLLSRVVNFSNNKKKELYISERKKQLDELRQKIISVWWSYIWVDNKTDYYKVLYNFFTLRKKLN